MGTFRAITGNTLYYKRRSSDIRQQCEIQDARFVRGSRKNWRDHLNRMPDDRLLKIVKTEKPNTARHDHHQREVIGKMNSPKKKRGGRRRKRRRTMSIPVAHLAKFRLKN